MVYVAHSGNMEKKTFRNTTIYIRTSTKEQNPKLQLSDCENIRPKDNKTDTFVDYYLLEDKQSAWKDNVERPQFNELHKRIKQHKVRNLIVWDLDRLYRNRKKLIEFFKLCKHYGCRIYSFRQAWLSEVNTVPAPWGEIVHDMMIQVMGWIAEDESNRKSKGIKLAVKQKRGVTVSYKGNKWGRKRLSTQKKNKIISLHKDNPKFSMRYIANEIGVSVGVVHKTLAEFDMIEKVIK